MSIREQVRNNSWEEVPHNLTVEKLQEFIMDIFVNRHLRHDLLANTIIESLKSNVGTNAEIRTINTKERWMQKRMSKKKYIRKALLKQFDSI